MASNSSARAARFMIDVPPSGVSRDAANQPSLFYGVTSVCLVCRQLLFEPVKSAGDEPQRGAAVVMALGVVGHRDVDAQVFGHVEEALDLGVHVKLVAAAVG